MEKYYEKILAGELLLNRAACKHICTSAKKAYRHIIHILKQYLPAPIPLLSPKQINKFGTLLKIKYIFIPLLPLPVLFKHQILERRIK